MNILVDLLIVSILAFCTFWGFKKGFIVTIFNMFGGFICFLISVFIARPVGSFLSKVVFKPVCSEYFENAFRNFLEKSTDSYDLQEVFSSAKDFFTRYGADRGELESAFENSSNADGFIGAAADAVATPVADSIGFLIAFIVILIVVTVLYKMLVKLLDLISKLPVLNASNKTLGIVCGLLHGVLNSVIFASVLFYLQPILQTSDSLFLSSFDIEKTFLAKIFSSFLN